MRKIFLLMFLLLISAVHSASRNKVTSPNGALRPTFNLDNTVPTYTAFRGKATVIKPSRLGFALVKGGDLLDGFTLVGEEGLGRRDMDTRMGREPHDKKPL